eukprot:TRINITY_DN284_c0_g1_i2.p1 TRINITY_DN284_c0_g1~~TRINITY_DN284_c0_g1_i2.p1  ORF type:complete len:248 (+),score=28.82 TRINITY_DN284_c0_g1_i2:73-744(+)
MCNGTHRTLMVVVLVLVILVFILNFLVVALPAYFYDADNVYLVGFTTLTSVLRPTEVYVGLFSTYIEYQVGDTTVDTIDFWRLMFPTCDYSAMEDKTKALQGFWCISQLCCLLLLILTSIKVCCKKDLSHWWIFGANIFVFVSVIIVSGVIGHQHNYDMCVGAQRSLNDMQYDLSAASFCLFVVVSLLFVSQILSCVASFCYQEEREEPDVVIVTTTNPDGGY